MVPAHMKRLQIIAILLSATVLNAGAAPKFALIRVKDIYSALPSTAELQQELKKERDAIMKSERATELRKIINELQGLQAKLSDKEHPLDEATARKLARSYEIKRQEAQTLQKEFEDFRAEQEKQINRKMVDGMRASLGSIMKVSQKVAKEKGYDLVFDGSGNTNTGVAFVLSNKNSPDLTDDVKAAMKDAAASAPAAPERPKSEPSKNR
jgi:Skp family chaperone for outer membrane proteins